MSAKRAARPSVRREQAPVLTEVEEARSQAVFQIFRMLDRDSSGLISKTEFEKILQALQEDTGVVEIDFHEEDITLQEFVAFTSEFEDTQLEDILWFVEHVVHVEKEMKQKWKHAVERWQRAVSFLNDKGLATVLLDLQEQKIRTWLANRLDAEGTAAGDREGEPGGATDKEARPASSSSSSAAAGGRKVENASKKNSAKTRLGLSVREVEILFEDVTFEEVEESYALVEPIVKVYGIVTSIHSCMDRHRADTSEEIAVQEMFQDVEELHLVFQKYDGVPPHPLLRAAAAAAVKLDALTLLAMATELAYEFEETPSNIVGICMRLMSTILDFNFGGSTSVMEEELRMKTRAFLEVSKGLVPRHRMRTVGDWVQTMIVYGSDRDRGRCLDFLLQWDKSRILNSPRGQLPAPSQLCTESVMRALVQRLRLNTHHAQHEQRTPLRTHIIRLIFNILVGAGDQGRAHFRACQGMFAFCDVLRGKFGVVRCKLPEEYVFEEFDFDDHVVFEQESRFYEDDFSDDAFYGKKDQQKVVDVLMALRGEELWGPEKLAQELAQCPYLLESFIQFGKAPLDLLNDLFMSPSAAEYAANLTEYCKGLVAKKYFGFLQQIPQQGCWLPSTLPFGCMSIPEDKRKQMLETLTSPMARYATFRSFLMAFNIEESYKQDTLDLLGEATPMEEDDIGEILACLLPLLVRHRVSIGVKEVRHMASVLGSQSMPRASEPVPGSKFSTLQDSFRMGSPFGGTSGADVESWQQSTAQQRDNMTPLSGTDGELQFRPRSVSLRTGDSAEEESRRPESPTPPSRMSVNPGASSPAAAAAAHRSESSADVGHSRHRASQQQHPHQSDGSSSRERGSAGGEEEEGEGEVGGRKERGSGAQGSNGEGGPDEVRSASAPPHVSGEEDSIPDAQKTVRGQAQDRPLNPTPSESRGFAGGSSSPPPKHATMDPSQGEDGVIARSATPQGRAESSLLTSQNHPRAVSVLEHFLHKSVPSSPPAGRSSSRMAMGTGVLSSWSMSSMPTSGPVLGPHGSGGGGTAGNSPRGHHPVGDRSQSATPGLYASALSGRSTAMSASRPTSRGAMMTPDSRMSFSRAGSRLGHDVAGPGLGTSFDLSMLVGSSVPQYPVPLPWDPMAYTHSIKHGPVAELEILDLVENAKSWSVPALDFAPVGVLSDSEDIASSLESMYQLLQIANARFECSPYVQHICSFMQQYLQQLLPTTNFAMPAPVPKYQEPIDGDMFHFRYSNFIVLRSLTLRYPNSTVLELAASLHQITHDMEAVQESGNLFVLWQLMAYFLFDLCGIFQSEVSLEGGLQGLFRMLGIPSMLFDLVASTVRDAPSSLVEQKMSHGVTVAHFSGLGSSADIDELCFVQSSPGGGWTLWASAPLAAEWCTLRRENAAAAAAQQQQYQQEEGGRGEQQQHEERRQVQVAPVPQPKCWCDPALVEEYFTATHETVPL